MLEAKSRNWQTQARNLAHLLHNRGHGEPRWLAVNKRMPNSQDEREMPPSPLPPLTPRRPRVTAGPEDTHLPPQQKEKVEATADVEDAWRREAWRTGRPEVEGVRADATSQGKQAR